PSSLPASVLLQHTPTTLTIFDAYPKSMFHFLILPRVLTSEPALTAKDISSLRTLCKRGKDQAKAVVFGLAEEAQRVRATIEEEMVNRYGFKWEIWTGFHTVPSMEHLHLHVLSADLVSSAMKNKRHYNSFHPTRGFFLHLDEVLSWFDSDDSSFATMSALDPTRYESLLKEDLSCFRCEQEFKQMPKLKEHLKEEWEKRRKR
ncbi:HIT-like protein, partial [Punctularia strigosozonata HHB-11173 SS5]|uniref:HIT-like protein n=1 Tax=Punctularia strigosozonata (strain HHB-11173) TaxID=741275 RepID=UPI0004417E8F